MCTFNKVPHPFDMSESQNIAWLFMGVVAAGEFYGRGIESV